jgi:hypothetical protein
LNKNDILNYSGEVPIFRGLDTEYSKFKIELKNENDVYFFEPRESRNSLTSNSKKYDTLWNLWFANNEKWKEYPSRKFRANICTTSPNYADQYGNVFLIIPAEDSKFGLCPKEDIFNSFSKSKIAIDGFHNEFDISSFSQFLDDIFGYIISEKKIDMKSFIESETYEQYIEKISIINSYFGEKRKEINVNDTNELYSFVMNINGSISGGDEAYHTGIEFILKSNNTLFEIIDEYFNPKLNNIQLFSNFQDFLENSETKVIGQYENKFGQELWFNGTYIALTIEEDKFLMRNILRDENLHIHFIDKIIKKIENIQE